MSKKSLTIIFILLASILGSLAYVLLSKEARQSDQASTSKTASTEEKMPVDSGDPGAGKGVYVPYSDEALHQAKGTVLLFFHAPWCSQCRAIEKTINEAGIPDNVTVLKIDYDTNQSLRQKYGVTLQTTFVKVDAKGDKLASYIAYDEPTFGAVQRELLP